jgi:murein DD-endopeptidase MepM/ murein hydrolase activator NlpD
LIARVYNYATQRQYDQARKLLQNPTIPSELRSQVLNNINSLESASRTLGITQAKQPTTTKPTRPVAIKPTQPPVTKSPARTLKPPAIFTGVPSISSTGRSQQTITIQVPHSSRSIAARSDAPSDGAYIDQIGSSVQVGSSKDLQAYNRNLPKLTSRDQIVYPLPDPVSVTSRFGWRRHPVTGVRRFHAGVDLGAGQGTPIIASRSGRVTAADQMGGYGLAVVMQQSDGKQDTLYAHMSQILVRPGQQIKAGTVIGRVGSTGLSTGPHLHYEARQRANNDWNPVDPGAQLEAARIRLVQARQMNAQRSEPTLQSALPRSNRGV